MVGLLAISGRYQQLKIFISQVQMKRYGVTESTIRLPRIITVTISNPSDEEFQVFAFLNGASVIENLLYEELHSITTSNILWISYSRIKDKQLHV